MDVLIRRYRTDETFGLLQDIASRAWRRTGKRTWIVELSVFADGRIDPETGWAATGLREASVIPEFFEHYRTMRHNGHIAGATWYWWLAEVTEGNGYILE